MSGQILSKALHLPSSAEKKPPHVLRYVKANCYGWNRVLQKDAEVLTPSPYEFDHVGKRGLCR